MYMVAKKLACKFQQTDKPVKGKNGNPLTTAEEQLKRWAEHFSELLNCAAPEASPDIHQQKQNCQPTAISPQRQK